MRKRKTTFKTYWPASPSIKLKFLAKIAPCVALLLASIATGSARADAPSLGDVLNAHLHAIAALGVKRPHTIVSSGTLDGLGLKGTFTSWRDGERERDDEVLGLRTQRTLRLRDVEYVQNANGDVRTLRGIMARRQITEDFIDSGDFARHPESDSLLGGTALRDGRKVWRIRVSPPGGETYDVALDAKTWMIDEKAYVDGDSLVTTTFDDYRVVGGALVPFSEVDSSGTAAFDVTSHVDRIEVDKPIDPAVFEPFKSVTIETAAPVTVPLLYDRGHLFVRGAVNGTPLLFLIDSGSQSVFLDPGAAQRLGLKTEGTLEVRGARRTHGLGVAALDAIDVGHARLPLHVVSVVDLSSVVYHAATVDGVLGYPFFAAAEVRIDPDRLTMTIGKPGMLPPEGTAIAIDTDRELPETLTTINSVSGRFLVDTGNSNELLVFHAFLQDHPSAVYYAGSPYAQNSGVGGGSAAVRAMVNEIDLGPYKMYNRYADIMLADNGAFADRNDAGNIGLGTLKNFVFTFDLAHDALFLDPTRTFDNGRFR